MGSLGSMEAIRAFLYSFWTFYDMVCCVKRYAINCIAQNMSGINLTPVAMQRLPNALVLIIRIP